MKKEVRRETSALFRQEKMKERHQTRRKKGEATITNQVIRFVVPAFKYVNFTMMLGFKTGMIRM